MTTRRALLGAPLAGLLAAPALHAQPGFPNRPLRIIVTYPPGGVTDLMGRIMAEPLGVRLGQPVVVENRAGAGGNIGVQAAAQADPDGYTLLLGTAATHGVNPVLYANSGVDAVRDFATIGTIADMANVLSVNPSRLDVKSVAELVARGKRGNLIYGSVGNGSSSHLSAVMFMKAAGFEAVHVPYRGSSPAVAALLAGEFDFLFDTTATSTTQIRAGAFRALAVTTGRRASALPDVPTLQEAGIAGYDLPVWNALFVHRRTPPEVLARLQSAFNQAMDETTQQRLRGAFVDPLVVPTAELPQWLEREHARWTQLARDAKLSVD
ncbi:tripartite tricarboxylate transporter substrate binding protein [Siccirubricoccus sp. G192]|uniref:Bug family tripartite tricarboxylate transporter substrate binding protein n=1 Tax=Siccirubricoccus sp. G192 TaxID=2849651 RepID=UPI001C2BDD8B|nr:tripartite tricarboxylate transporter substrate binding protein [Siccirubricoccus sp. G192]MBV1795591.1 tripartite tricarboxylate transporter substrate binding protein [Siccirubricoccus sp. G192]MBV1800265.1 tripartite tricarboxylate transporter substrate binding protein [Siccirubricoccus sp. G192]